ncbi:cupin domain-containing protein [Brachybacterium kimchii]|uniref:Cupin domain-containing protein n=1 Tax=Brachybacterium kimchii TaxID=2942909 RepID=A0ABY4N5P8_9MICO|nr:cupin domain-containing protein [Brachybacterium kimchii]UQN29886.1 cupin domain-containing protein [Brachybacterium kimchii]
MDAPTPDIRLLDQARVAGGVGPAHVMTVSMTLEPGSPGSPPHRHSGPVFGYLLEGELVFELEGEPERIIRTGEAFWEPGGDLIHYQAANHLAEAPTTFIAVMVCAPGEEMMTFVSEQELAERAHLRHPRSGG